MHMQLTNALILAQTQEWNPSDSAGKIKAALLAFLAVALIFVSLWAVIAYARKGDMGKTAKVTGAVVIALLPLAIVAPVVLGRQVWTWIF